MTIARDGSGGRFAAVSWPGRLRGHQERALAALDAAEAAGRGRVWLVMPPGAGKTLTALEFARRRGHRVVVFVPNTAIQGQWVRTWDRFEPALETAGTDRDLRHAVTVLTYQSLAVFDAEAEGRIEKGEENGGGENSGAENGGGDSGVGDGGIGDGGGEPGGAGENGGGESGNRENGNGGARGARRARAEVPLLEFLHPNGRALIAALREAGPLTVVLDECHHLLETWGRVVAELLDELPCASVLGLTATPPDSLSAVQAALVDRLFGAPVTGASLPAVIKAGYLAPYAELAYLAAPTPTEADFVAGETERFAEFRNDLMRDGFSTVSFLEWCDARFVERRVGTGTGGTTAAEDGDEGGDGSGGESGDTSGSDKGGDEDGSGSAARQTVGSAYASTAGPGQGSISWAQLEIQHQPLARAALRLHHAGLLALPPGAQPREEHRQDPLAEDWVALLDDYVSGCLSPSDAERDAAAVAAIRAALPSIGYRLTRNGIRAAQSPVDRVLARSDAKTDAAVQIAAAEAGNLGADLRVLILCDFERAGATVPARLVDVLDAQAGGARLTLERLVADERTAALAPMLVTGRTVAAGAATARDFAAWAARQDPELLLTLTRDPAEGGADGSGGGGGGIGSSSGKRDEPGIDDEREHVVVIGGTWTSRTWVALVTEYFQQGRARVLVGTRALLGEGWDAQAVNTVIDLTCATTTAAVVQLRGRGLRTDPRHPDKTAHNWSVVCVTDSHPKGAADWQRFVRKHEGYLAVDDTGEIVSGVGHVDASFSPYEPPKSILFDRVNARMLERAEDRGRTRELWAVGAPYRDELVPTIRIRVRSSSAAGGGGADGGGAAGRAGIGSGVEGGSGAESGRGRGLTALAPADLRERIAAAGLLPGPSGLTVDGGRRLLMALRPRHAARLLAAASGPPPVTTLAHVVADALRDCGLCEAGAEAVRAAVEPDGTYRLHLESGPPGSGGGARKRAGADTTGPSGMDAARQGPRRFAAALDELIAPIGEPRWFIPRYEIPAARTGSRAAARTAARAWLWGRGEPNTVVYHPVPAVFARSARRREIFAEHWHRRVSPGEPVATASPEGEGVLVTHRGLSPLDADTALRVAWH